MLIIITFYNGDKLVSEQCGKISDYVYADGECNVIASNRNASKYVALTFDDGPCVKNTTEILEILKEHDIKATFFIVGENADKNPEIVKMIHKDGHEIGNHTYTHPNLRTIPQDEIEEEISKCSRSLKNITGSSPILFRPPGGYLNNNIVNYLEENNMKTILWSWRQDTLDWKCPPANDIINTVLSNIRDGDIILFHDFIPGTSHTPQALRTIIPELISKGYKFVTVSDLTAI